MAREIRRNSPATTPELARRLRIAQTELDTFVSGLSKVAGYLPGMGTYPQLSHSAIALPY